MEGSVEVLIEIDFKPRSVQDHIFKLASFDTVLLALLYGNFSIVGGTEDNLTSCLITACEFGYASTVVFLLDRGADPSVQNNYCPTQAIVWCRVNYLSQLKTYKAIARDQGCLELMMYRSIHLRLSIR